MCDVLLRFTPVIVEGNHPHGGIKAQAVDVVHVILATKAAKNRIAELTDQAMPSVLAGTAFLEKNPDHGGQTKAIVKLQIGDKPGA